MQCAAHEPLYDIDPRTGISIEVFYSDPSLDTFGRGCAGWRPISGPQVSAHASPAPARAQGKAL
jgi:hypothetical protein